MVSRDPEIVVKDPLGSVDTEGGILVTEKLCDAGEVEKVSVDPEIVVMDPSGSVEVVGRITLTDGLEELLKMGAEDKVETEPEIVVNEPFGSVDVVGGMLVTDRFPLGELVLLNGFVLVPDIKLLLNGLVFVPDIKLLIDVEALDEDGGWIEVGLEELGMASDVELEVERE